MNCDFFEGKICGGPNRGICNCGQCICNEKWSGVKCGCTTDQSNCIDPVNGKVCNNRGSCDCGLCRCHETQYNGPYCDECPTCPGQCPSLAKIVERQIGDSRKEVSGENFVSYLTENFKTYPEDKVCKFIGQDKCLYTFKYRSVYSNKQNLSSASFLIEAFSGKACKEPANIAVYSTRFIAVFIVIGVFSMVVWRIGTFLIDRHEYNKFIKSCQNINFPEVE